MRYCLKGKLAVVMVLTLLLTCLASGAFATSAEFKVDTDLGDNFIARFTLFYDGSKVLDDPRLEFDFNHKITAIWDAEIASEKGNHYVITLPGHISSLPPGEIFKFGFNASPGFKGGMPKNVKLNGVPVRLTSN